MFEDLDEKMKHDWKLRWYHRKQTIKLDISEWYCKRRIKTKKYFHILKLRILWRLGIPLTSNARGELARWITRNVTESNAETLRKVRSGAPIDGGPCKDPDSFCGSDNEFGR